MLIDFQKRELMQNSIYYFTLLFAFISPLSRAGIVFTSVTLILLWIFEKGWVEKWNQLKSCKVFQAFGIFIIYNFISLIWTDEVLDSFKYILKYWYLITAFVIFTSFPKEKSGEIIKFFILGMLVSEILSYGILFEFWTMKHGTVSDPTPFMNHLDYSIFLAFTSILLLIKVLYSDDIRNKIMYSIFFLTVSGNLFVTAGRSGQLAFFVTLPIILFIFFNKKVLKSLFIIFVTIGIMLIFPMLLSDTFKNRVLNVKTDFDKLFIEKSYNSSLGNRIGAWEVASDIAKDNPILGVGNQDNIIELQRITTEKPHLQPLNWYPHFHNQYLQISTALGILGILIFIYIFVQIGKLKQNQENIYLIKTAFISIFLVGFIAEPFLHKQFTMALFSIILGYILINKNSDNIRKNNLEM